MDFGLSEEQQLLQETLRRYLEGHCPVARLREIAGREDGHDAELWQGLTELGVPGALIPADRGGSGLALLDAALIAQTLGWAATPTPFVAAAVMAPVAFVTAGTTEQQREWLPKLAAGRARLGVAVTEVYARREKSGVKLDGERLVGKALFALDCGAADGFLVATGTRGLFVVPAGAKGLAVETLKTIDRTRRVAELSFDRVQPADQIGGRRGAATAIARMLDAGRVVLAADTLGACDRAIEMAVAYAKERKQFGRLIGSFQAVKHMCAEMVAEIEPARSLLWYAAHAFDAVPEESRKVALLAKAHLSDVGTEVLRKATEVFGGIGFTDEGELHLWFKRVGLNRQLLGGPKQLRAQVELGRGEARDEHPNPYL
jgi:alkylation response protein AidB-like acyl-CoA dehydrogenase